MSNNIKINFLVVVVLLCFTFVYSETGDEVNDKVKTEDENMEVDLSEGLKPFFKMTHTFLDLIEPTDIPTFINDNIEGMYVTYTDSTVRRPYDTY